MKKLFLLIGLLISINLFPQKIFYNDAPTKTRATVAFDDLNHGIYKIGANMYWTIGGDSILRILPTGLDVVGDVTADNLNIANWDAAFGWGNWTTGYNILDGRIIADSTNLADNYTNTTALNLLLGAKADTSAAALIATVNTFAKQQIFTSAPVFNAGAIVGGSDPIDWGTFSGGVSGTRLEGLGANPFELYTAGTLGMTMDNTQNVVFSNNLQALTYSSASVTDTELGYLDGVTSSIQTQFGGKQDTLYLSGLDSNVQDQIDAIVASAPVWGSITGTLSNQTDLALQLGAKADSSRTAFTDTKNTFDLQQTFTAAPVFNAGIIVGGSDPIDWGTFSGGVSGTRLEGLGTNPFELYTAGTLGMTMDNTQNAEFSNNLKALTYGTALVTDTELGYVDGVTSNIQAQLDALSPTVGTVTSVAMTTPTGLDISGSPITTSGTLALSLTAGYEIPTTVSLATYKLKSDSTANSGYVTQYDRQTSDWTGTFDGQEGTYYLARANHTGTQTASTISDFDTEVSNNTDVAANTSARHSAVTLAGSLDYITLSGQEITRNAIVLTTDVSGVLPVANGGTGLSSISTLLNTNNTLQTVTNNGATTTNGITAASLILNNGGADIIEGSIVSGTTALRIGADLNANTRTNATRKIGVMSFPHYTNAEEDIAFFWGDSQSGESALHIGGELGGLNAVTEVNFYTGATTTTLAGSVALTLASDQSAVFSSSVQAASVDATNLTTTFFPYDNGTSLINSVLSQSGGNLDAGGANFTTTGIATTNTGSIFRGIITLGENTGTSGQINFIASDNDQGNIVINTSDILTFNSFSGGYTFDDVIRTDDVTDATSGTTGSIQTDGGIGAVKSIYSGANIDAVGEITAFTTSDRRLKKNIKPLNNALGLINNLNVKTFRWNSTAKDLNRRKDNRLNYGFIAQELQKTNPELIHKMYDKYLGVDYEQIIPILVKANQEQQEKILSLEQRIEKLETLILK